MEFLSQPLCSKKLKLFESKIEGIISNFTKAWFKQLVYTLVGQLKLYT